MPWSLEHSQEGWLVLDEDGATEGTHASRTDAIKHQRRLYATEARVAAMYADLDSLPIVELVEPVAAVPEVKSELVKIEIGDQALTAALVQKMDAMSERQAQTEQALVAALQAIGTRDSVVNVHPPTVEAPNVTVEAPNITVESPTVNVPAAQITVQPANVVLPERQKTVTFERDPLTQQVTKAEVVET